MQAIAKLLIYIPTQVAQLTYVYEIVIYDMILKVNEICFLKNRVDYNVADELFRGEKMKRWAIKKGLF